MQAGTARARICNPNSRGSEDPPGTRHADTGTITKHTHAHTQTDTHPALDTAGHVHGMDGGYCSVHETEVPRGVAGLVPWEGQQRKTAKGNKTVFVDPPQT